MATHESWQFAFVREIPTGTYTDPQIGMGSPLRVEESNLPVGSIPQEDQPTEIVAGDHIRVYYSIPEDTIRYALTGKVKILKKTKEFPRGYNDSLAVEVLNEDFSTTLGSITRDTYTLVLDEIQNTVKQKWYYTVFYEGKNQQGDFVWAFSPINGHGRALFLSSGASLYGDQLFDYMPTGIKRIDNSSGGDALSNFLHIIGKAFDELGVHTEEFKKNRYLPETVDAAFIPYIDQLLGWPTNFELSEVRRRYETKNATSVWKAKGGVDALEFVLQDITGWDVSFYQGLDYILTTTLPNEVLDPNSPPAGWDQNTDGVWADQVNAIPFNGSVDLTTPGEVIITGSIHDNYRVISDLSLETWKNPFGVLVRLVAPTASETPLFNFLAKDKVHRLLGFLGIHYANFKIQLADYYTEGLEFIFGESSEDRPYRSSDDSASFEIIETVSTTSSIPLLYTYAHADPLLESVNITWVANHPDPTARLFHTAFT
jgi:hypothetical protein